MNSNNHPLRRTLPPIIGGAVRTSGGALTLGKGELAIVDNLRANADGAKVLSSTDLLGMPKRDKRIQLRVGIMDKAVTRSNTNKAPSTPAFALNDVVALRVSAPVEKEIHIDDVIVGFNGTDPASSFVFKTGDAPFKIAMEMKGGPLKYRGGVGNDELVVASAEIPYCNPLDNCEDCDACTPVDCSTIILPLIEQMRNKPIQGGNLVSDYVDITPVLKDCGSDLDDELIPYVFWTLEVCDTGDDEALTLVQNQYPSYKVNRVKRSGPTTTYELLIAESDGTPTAYSQSVAGILKGCEDCPADYTAVTGGYLYAITIEDDGADSSSVITTNLANAKYATGTIIRATGQDAGVGFYTAVYTSKITDAEINTFNNSNSNARRTATVKLWGSIEDFCENTDTTDIDWVEGDSCNVTEHRYKLLLPDTKCGDDRLAELQAYYGSTNVYAYYSTLAMTLTGVSGAAAINIGGADYAVTFDATLTNTADEFVASYAADLLADFGITVTAILGVLNFSGPSYYLNGITITNNAAQDVVTLTGTSGTANISVGGVNYLATFNTDLTTTASDFDTAHSAAILAATGVTVTSSGAALTFIGSSDIINGISITNATGDLAGSGAVTLNLDATLVVAEDLTGSGCNNEYEMLALSNLVCEECDSIYLDRYRTEAPQAFGEYKWVRIPGRMSDPEGTCKCGIRFRGKQDFVSAEQALRLDWVYDESAVQIQVSAGFPEDVREGIGRIPEGEYPVLYRDRYVARTHVAGNLLCEERQSFAYFLGEYSMDYKEQLLKSLLTHFPDLSKQYVMYALTVNVHGSSNRPGNTVSAMEEYRILVEVGRHEAIETALNNLAAAAGIEGVRAYAVTP